MAYTPTPNESGQYDYMWINGRWFKHQGNGSYGLSETPPPEGASANPIYAGSPPPQGWWSAQMQGQGGAPVNTSPTAGATDRIQGVKPTTPPGTPGPGDPTQGQAPPYRTYPGAGPGTPGYTSLPPGGRGNSSQGAPPRQPQLAGGTYAPEEEFDAAFRRALSGLGAGTNTFFGRNIYESNIPGQLNAALLGRAATGGGGPPTGTPENRSLEGTLLQGGLGGIANFGQIAQEAIRRLFSQGGAQGGLAEGFLDPSNMGNQANLALGAARGQLGGYFASNLLPSAQELMRRFGSQSLEQQQPQGTDPNLGFLNYALQRFGMR